MRKFLLSVILWLIAIGFSLPAFSQPCAAPLNGGTLTALADSVCATQAIAISVAGGSTGTGFTYQWEASTDNATWTTLAGYSQEGLFNLWQTTSRWYRRKVKCNAGDSAYSSSLRIVTKTYNDCYCKPFGYACNPAYRISKVEFGSLSKSSTCGPTNYTSYVDSMSAMDLPQGSWLPIRVTAGTGPIANYVHCFIDFDQGGNFGGRGEHVLLLAPTANVYSGFIKVPFRAKTGTIRLRIIYSASAEIFDGCYPDQNAETEDYPIRIVPKTSPANGHVIYVKPNPVGTNGSGASWANALFDMRSAINLATAGDTIKAAKGTYYNGTAQTNGLTLVDSITLLGGYPDSGNPTDAQRAWAQNPTVLVGAPSAASTNFDYHTIFASGTMNDCTVDGFVIQKGGNYYGSSAEQSRGGGISIENGANITVRNTVFRLNSEAAEGSAISVYNAKPVFENCIVTAQSPWKSSIVIQNGSDVRFTNLLAAKNGGESLLHVAGSKVAFRNSTIAGNTLTRGLGLAAGGSEVSFTNSILYYNAVYNASWQSTSLDSTEIQLDGATAAFHHSLTQVRNNGTELLLGQSPKFRDTAALAGADGFYFTGDDGFTLQNPCSPAINAGSTSDAAGIATDIKGAPRVFENKVDIGAYETQQNLGLVPKLLYVNAAATGANDGSSWANAFTDLHKALQACSDTIKVAAGTYSPWKSSTPQPYWFENKRIVWGGYPATGNPGNSARNFTLHPSIVDGLQPDGERGEIVIRGQNLDSTSVVDGFTVTNTGRYTYHYEYGAVIYSHCNNPVISNVLFTGNQARLFWGRHNKRPQFLHCRFNNNSSPTSYRLDFVFLQNSGQTAFRHCEFRNNTLANETGITYEFGRVLIISGTDAQFDSCVFSGNRSAALHIVGSRPAFRAVQFLQNFASGHTSVMRNVLAEPVFRHCVFRDSVWSSVGSHTSGMMKNQQSAPSFYDCQFYNGISERGGVAFNEASKARFVRCVFSRSNNTFYNTNGSHMELTNCINNGSNAPEAAYVGWGRTGSFMQNIASSPVLRNCIVVNSISGQAGVINNDAASHPEIYNSIFWKNFRAATADHNALKSRMDIVNAAGAMPVIRHSMFEFYNAGSLGNNTTGVDPRLKRLESPIGNDSTWFTADDGLQLCDCSPALNSGDNSVVAEPTDIALKNRTVGGAVDRGAYEFQSTPVPAAPTVYVDAAKAVAGNGQSWSLAYSRLQDALANACADTIKLAAGVYKPAGTARDSSFFLNRNAVISGSFSPATGKQDVEKTPSVLSGDIGVDGDSTDNSFGLMKVIYADSVTLDGLVFRDANNGNQPASANNSGLWAEYVQKLTVANSRFYNNTAHNNGGGLLLQAVFHSHISSTVFQRNKAGWGGGLYAGYNGPVHTVTNTVFDRNIGSIGGGAYITVSGYSFANCVFTGNRAQQGGGLLLENNPAGAITNCTFASNRIEGGWVGAGIYATAYSWQGSGIGPLIGNCIFTGNGDGGPNGQLPYADIYFPKNGYTPSDGKVEMRIHHTASSTAPIYYYGGGMVSPGSVSYSNEKVPAGADGIWFTADDGLQPTVCSPTIDAGDNDASQLAIDMAGNNRRYGAKIDLGAYEYNGQLLYTGLLASANDSLTANKEVTDTLGWTHYFADCRYLLSIKKEGKNIGKVGDGSFELKVFTSPNYGSGFGTNLTAAAYNTGGKPWYVMNRYWNVKSVATIGDSILIRFPYTTADFNDTKGSNPALTKHEDMDFFKVGGTNNPFDLSVTAANFVRYKNDALASLKTWRYLQQDTIHLSEFYVKSFSGGGGGALYAGPLPDLTIAAQAVAPAPVGTGNKITVSFTEANNAAGGDAGGHKVHLYLSADANLTPGISGDTLLGTVTVGGLKAGENTGSLQKELLIACTTTPGNYRLFVVADGSNAVVETDENNNLASVPFTIVAGLTKPATPVITASPGTTVCAGTKVTLTVLSPGCTNCTYSWNQGTGGATTTNEVYSAGTYTVTATNVCGTATSSQQIVVNMVPQVSGFSERDFICQGDSVTLRGFGADTYLWRGEGIGDSTSASIRVKPASTGAVRYTVTGTKNGCSATATAQVGVLVSPLLTISPADTSFCAGASLTLTASGAAAYAWSPATGLNTTTGPSVIASPTAVTTYTLTGTGTNGCQSTLTRTLRPQASVTPSVSIAYSGCPDNRLQFTATPSGGGTNPQYQWYLNGVLQGSGASITLSNVVNGAEVYAQMTSGIACASPQTVRSDTVKVACITTALPQIDAVEVLTVSPNPSTGLVNVRLKLTQRRTVSFKATTAGGKVVYQSTPENIIGQVVKPIDLGGLPQGLYFLHIYIGNKTAVEKLVIAR